MINPVSSAPVAFIQPATMPKPQTPASSSSTEDKVELSSTAKAALAQYSSPATLKAASTGRAGAASH